jgi:hypothetical protein
MDEIGIGFAHNSNTEEVVWTYFVWVMHAEGYQIFTLGDIINTRVVSIPAHCKYSGSRNSFLSLDGCFNGA